MGDAGSRRLRDRQLWRRQLFMLAPRGRLDADRTEGLVLCGRLLDTGQRWLEALSRREDAKLEALLIRQIVDSQPPEDVVDQRRGNTQIGVVGNACGLEA